MVKKYILSHDRELVTSYYPAGTTVYEFLHTDFGLSEQESQFYGFEFVSVTLDPNGNYPSFTVPVAHLKEA